MTRTPLSVLHFFTRRGRGIAHLVALLATGCASNAGHSGESGFAGGTTSGSGGGAGIDLGNPGGPVSGTFLDIGGPDASLSTSGSGSSAPPHPSGSDASVCASVSHTGQALPVDIFIMMDQSGSMLDSVTGPGGAMGAKWSFLLSAFTTFINDPKSAGLGIGIGYFPTPADDSDANCVTSIYATPDVPIAALPGNAMPMISSLNGHKPNGHTPTLPALTGSLQYAQAWAMKNPTHKVALVFATDGDPHGCTNNTIAASAAVVQTALAATPSIPTYVIGIGKSLTSLNAIAMAGGTGQAFVINTAQDTEAQFAAAMASIRAAAISCDFSIPSTDGGAVDFNRVNVVGTLDDGGTTSFYQVADSTKCTTAGEGWYYDNPSAPTKIQLCPTSCSDFSMTTVSAKVDVVLGCQTVTSPPPPR